MSFSISISSNSNGGAVLGVLILTILASAFSIASIVVSQEDGNNICQGVDKTGITLKTWLFLTGIIGLCVNVVVALSIIGIIVFDWGACIFPAGCTFVLGGIFSFVWCIVGIIIIARSHHDCVDDSTSLGVMTVIMLILQGTGICCFGCAAAGSKVASM